MPVILLASFARKTYESTKDGGVGAHAKAANGTPNPVG
jgi:hypothetical protein